MSRKTLAGLIAFGIICLSLIAAIALSRNVATGGGDAVALIRLSGPIQESASLFAGGSATPSYLRERLDRAAQSRQVAAVVLRIDSPGGTVASSQEMADMVRDFPKPVVASMGDVAASGGYYVAAAADHIVAEPGTLTGSIGVIWTMIDPSGLLDKLGIEIEAITAGEHKDMFLPGEMSREERRIVRRIVNTMYDQFISAVTSGRDLTKEEVERLATGELFTGTQALESGLVDTTGGLEEALARAEELAGIDDARLVEYEPSLIEMLFSRPGGTGTESHPTLDREAALIRELLQGYLVPRY